MATRGRVKGFLFVLALLGLMYLAFAVMYRSKSPSSPMVASNQIKENLQESQRMLQKNHNVPSYSSPETVNYKKPQEQEQQPQLELQQNQQLLIQQQQKELQHMRQKLDEQKQNLQETVAQLQQQQQQQQQLLQQQLQQQQLPQQQQPQLNQKQQEELFQKLLSSQKNQGQLQQQPGIVPANPATISVGDIHNIPSSVNNQPDTSAAAVPIQPTGNNGLHPDVNVVPATPNPNLVLPYKDCVPLPESPKSGVQICLHPIKDDKWVSGSLKKNKLWEANLVNLMKKALENDTSLMLMDVGCNIGQYTLMASSMGRRVVAVEMLPVNVRLVQTSLQLSGLSDKVTIVNNALYRDHRILTTKFMSGNLGGSRLNTSKVYEPIDTNRAAVSVKTICLDDLIPLIKGTSVYMKMDIENSEHHALACADNFFKQINVKVVQMEWLHRTKEESSEIMNFMDRHGYLPSKSPIEYTPVVDNIANGDRFFLKKSTFHLS